MPLGAKHCEDVAFKGVFILDSGSMKEEFLRSLFVMNVHEAVLPCFAQELYLIRRPQILL